MNRELGEFELFLPTVVAPGYKSRYILQLIDPTSPAFFILSLNVLTALSAQANSPNFSYIEVPLTGADECIWCAACILLLGWLSSSLPLSVSSFVLHTVKSLSAFYEVMLKCCCLLAIALHSFRKADVGFVYVCTCV